MKPGLSFGIGIVLGAGGAVVVARILLKQHYEQKADEEIAACREAFVAELANRRAAAEKKQSDETKKAAEEALQTYSGKEPVKTEVVESAKPVDKPEPPKDKAWKPPYVISPEEFDSPDNPNKALSLKYFPKDGVVAEYETDEALDLEEIDRRIGRESLTHFGEYEEDRVCVRNDNWGVDYEVCIQGRSYNDVLKEKPWLKK